MIIITNYYQLLPAPNSTGNNVITNPYTIFKVISDSWIKTKNFFLRTFVLCLVFRKQVKLNCKLMGTGRKLPHDFSSSINESWTLLIQVCVPSAAAVWTKRKKIMRMEFWKSGKKNRSFQMSSICNWIDVCQSICSEWNAHFGFNLLMEKATSSFFNQSPNYFCLVKQDWK